MIPLTSEQIEYKERTLNQLLLNQQLLESGLQHETRPEVVKSIESQLDDIEAHISRLQDELAGVIIDEPLADDLFNQAVKALANEKFFLAKKHIHRLETIEPFYPALDRLRQEAESGRASRRTRSIARGTASSYPGIPPPSSTTAPVGTGAGALPQAVPANAQGEGSIEEGAPWYSNFFQLHIIISCLTVAVLGCLIIGIFGVMLLQWLIEGG